ncbi:MAG: YbjQ family protein [Planctomycetota bacterium]
MAGLIAQLGVPALLVMLGLVAGRIAERMHFRDLARRERAVADMLVTDIRSFPGGAEPESGAALVMGQAVIATDYLKTFLAGLRKIVGGEMRSYRSLMLRARREAVLRMLEKARDRGFDAVCNVRLNTAPVSGTRRTKAAMVEVMATGTAYSRQKDIGDEKALLGPVD